MIKLISIKYFTDDRYKYLKGELLEETETELKIKGFGDGTIFTISKYIYKDGQKIPVILERQDKEKEGESKWILKLAVGGMKPHLK